MTLQKGCRSRGGGAPTGQHQRTWCSFSAAAALPPHSSVSLAWLVKLSIWPAVRVAFLFIPTLWPLFWFRQRRPARGTATAIATATTKSTTAAASATGAPRQMEAWGRGGLKSASSPSAYVMLTAGVGWPSCQTVAKKRKHASKSRRGGKGGGGREKPRNTPKFGAFDAS